MEIKKNKPVKVTQNGRHQGFLDLHRTFWGRVWYKIKYWTRQAIKWTLIIGVIGLSFWIYFEINPSVIYTQAEVIKEITKVPPVLERIAQAESHKSHYCTPELVKSSMCRKSEIGQVLARSNSDSYRSIDVGYYQINLYYWGEKATARGLNIFKEEDNKAMGEWIFSNYGSEPWGSSSKNW